MVSIYILNLECDKLYVGRTSNIDFRLDDHFNNCGSYWTKKYKPQSVKEIYKNCTNYDEDKYTIWMMAQYGIDNVRGGSFTQINLTDNEISIIQKMINNANDLCFKCYMNNHYANECPQKEIMNNILLILRRNLIDNCIKNDTENNKFIEVTELARILKDTDNVIFDGIEEKQIKKICDKINKNKLNGIKFINYFSNFINYIDFCVGFTILINEVS
jgi:GIY-YIG catalytic domain